MSTTAANKKIFGTCADGMKAHIYSIKNSSGMEANISDFGGVLVSLIVKDRNGRKCDVVTGYDTLKEYEADTAYFGALVGRCANRIKGGRFNIDGMEYDVSRNEGKNHLHGGQYGFNKRIWHAEQTAPDTLKLTLFSPDKDQGYPGNLIVCVVYKVTEDNALDIAYSGFSDKKTVFNMTHHAYFMLGGQNEDSILDDFLRIRADAVTEIDNELIPTGRITDVGGTPFDFREMKKIGRDIGAGNTQLIYGNGYDHNFIIKSKNGEPCAEAYCESTGIYMSVYTDLPGLQLYTGNHLSGMTVKGGRKAERHSAFCLEAQYFPDAVNHAHFAQPVIESGEYRAYSTRYAFSVR